MRRVVAITVGAILMTALGPAAANAADVVIRTLSNRADLISGGDALVQVVLPPGTDAGKVKVQVDGRDVTSAFAVRADGRFLGLSPACATGANVAHRDARQTATARG